MSRKSKRSLLMAGLLASVFAIVLGSMSGFYQLKDLALVFADDSIVTSVYQDVDLNGTVDRIRWELDETVTGCVYEAGDWSVDVGGDMNVVVTGISCTTSDAFLDIAVTADANITGGFTDPVISYANQGNVDDVTLTSGPMTAKTQQATDNAAPALLSVGVNPQYIDTDLDGNVERTLIFFTEAVDYTYDDTDWTVTANDLTGYDVFDCNVCTGAYPLELLNSFTPGLTGVSGGTEPTIEYAFNSSPIFDAVGNFLLAFGPVSLVDNAAPNLANASYLDANADGTVDTIRTTWTEFVSMSGSTVDDWNIVPGDINAVFASAPNDASDGLTLDVLVTADANETGGAVSPTIGYDNDDANNSVVDSPLAAGTTISVPVTDAVAPVFVSSVSADVNADGTVDRTVITYSESVAITDGNAGDGFPGVAFNNSCVAANADYASADTTTSTVNLTGCTAGNTALLVTPTYTAAAGQILDLAIAPNEMSDAETVTGTDGAAPVVTALSMLDTNGDGVVNRVTLTYNENLADTAAAAN